MDRARRTPPVARSRAGDALSGAEIPSLLIRGEHLQPAALRVLKVLVSAEGDVIGFDELALLAAIGRPDNTTIDRADRLHRHVHYIRRALIDDCWVASVGGEGFVFRRRARVRA